MTALNDRERDQIEQLRVLGITLTDAAILDVLRRNNFDLDRAASEVLALQDQTSGDGDGPPGLESVQDENMPPPLIDTTTGLIRSNTPTLRPIPSSSGSAGAAPPPTPRAKPSTLPSKNNSIVDLTDVDDEEEQLRKAIEYSLASQPADQQSQVHDQSTSTTTFKPSNRTDANQNWALVPTSGGTMAGAGDQDADADYKRAMEASMNTHMDYSYTHTQEHIPTGEIWRGASSWENYRRDVPPSEWAEPLALVARDPGHLHAVGLFQAIFEVPGMREAFRKARIPEELDGSLMGRSLHEVQTLFTGMEYSQRAFCDISPLADTLCIATGSRVENVPQRTNALVETLMTILASTGWKNRPPPALDPTPSASGAPTPSSSPSSSVASFAFCVISPSHETNDLYSALDAIIHPTPSSSENEPTSPITFQPPHSEVLLVSIDRPTSTPIGPQPKSLPTQVEAALSEDPLRGKTGAAKEVFKFPATLYADQWTQRAAGGEGEKRDELKLIGERIMAGLEKLKILVGPDDNPHLPHLKRSLHYAENVASNETKERKEANAIAAKKLRAIIGSLEGQVTETKEAIRADYEAWTGLRTPTSGDPRNQYHLRAVLVHDGQFGAKSLHSYVRCGTKGTWFKVHAGEVSEVSEETVLNDRAGLYMNSGPYFLAYSKDSAGEGKEVPTSPIAAVNPGLSPRLTMKTLAPPPPIIATTTWPLECLRTIEQDNRTFRQTYLHSQTTSSSSSSSGWPHTGLSPEEFENLDPLARDERLYGALDVDPESGAEVERERRPLRVVGGLEPDGDDGDVEMTPPRSGNGSPEGVVSDTEMTDD